MTDYVRPNISRTFADVAHNLKITRRSGGLWRNFDSGKLIERSEAYMNGSRTLYEMYRPLMEPSDESNVVTTYNM